MKVRVLKHSKNEMKIEIEGEGHSFGSALQSALLEDRNVEFAGYNVPHPLFSKSVVYVRTKGGERAETALKKAAKRLEKRMNELQKLFEASLK